MKYFALLLVASLAIAVHGAGLEGNDKEKLAALSKKCMDSTGVSEDLVVKGRKGEFTEDPKLEEYYFCAFKGLQFINDAGVLNEGAVRTRLPSNLDKAKADELIAKCKDQKGDTPKKTAFLAFKCYKQNSDFSLL